MKFYQFWVRHHSQPAGTDFPVTELGYSNESLDDARRVAEQRAAKSAHRWASGKLEPPGAGYYPNRPIREEIIEQFRGGDQVVAVITRNRYGCLVLNAKDVLFADIDLPHTAGPSFFSRLFGKQAADPAAEIIERIEQRCAADSRLGLRLYRTYQGFRCLVTSQRYQPDQDDARRLLGSLNSDPRYVQLCQHQQDCCPRTPTTSYARL